MVFAEVTTPALVVFALIGVALTLFVSEIMGTLAQSRDSSSGPKI